jgi:hypothetical protein
MRIQVHAEINKWLTNAQGGSTALQGRLDRPPAVSPNIEFMTMYLLTPKFGKESDLWVRFDKESVWRKEGSFQRYSVKRSAVGYLLQFGKGTVELILRD